MKKFRVVVQETVTTFYGIDADNEDHARQIIEGGGL